MNSLSGLEGGGGAYKRTFSGKQVNSSGKAREVWSADGVQGLKVREAYRYSDDGVSDEQLFLPMQDQAAGKMPSRLDGRHPGQHFFGRT